MRVLITQELVPPAEERLQAAGAEVRVLSRAGAPGREALLAAVSGCDALLTTLADRVDAQLLDAAGPTLRVVANYAVGFENIDLRSCLARGVAVTNTPGVLTQATADLTWALILATARRVGEGERLVRGGDWRGWRPMQLLGADVHGATLGIVGAGRIGSAVALRSRGFDMRVLYAHPRQNADLEQKVAARRVPLDELMRQADFVSLHMPMRPENQHLIDRARLAQMKPGAILINTARGAVVDEAALIRALRNGPLAAAGLDVYEFEPRVSAELREMSNVVLLPHLGSATQTTRRRMAEMAADNIVTVLSGGAPLNPVRPTE